MVAEESSSLEREPRPLCLERMFRRRTVKASLDSSQTGGTSGGSPALQAWDEVEVVP